MKKIILCLAVFASIFSMHSQIETPQASPFSKIEQKVGLTDVTVEYSRPAMKGRTIFGDLVPYEKTWRTGANGNTKITFSTPVSVDGKTLEAGTYAIYTVPFQGKWQIMFYSDATNWGLPAKWDDDKVKLTAVSEVSTLSSPVESFTIMVGDLTNDSFNLGLQWEKTHVGLKIDVPTHKMVMMNIEETMKKGATADDYYAAAVYYFQNDVDLNKAKDWIDMALKDSDKPQFWKLRQQSLIYAKSGDTKQAISIAKRSLAAAEEAGNADYVKMNKDSIKEWSSK